MMTLFEAQVGMLNFAGPRGMERAQRIHATVRWVREACERDGYPTWLVDMVIERVQRDLLAGDFPLVEVAEHATAPVVEAASSQATHPELPDFVDFFSTTRGGRVAAPPPGRPNPMPTSGGYKLKPSDLYVVRGHEPGPLETIGAVLFVVVMGITTVAALVLAIASHVSVR